MKYTNGRRRRRNTPACLARESSFRSLLAASTQRPVRGQSRRGAPRGRSFTAPAVAPAPAAAGPELDGVIAPLWPVTNWDETPGGRAAAIPAAAALLPPPTTEIPALPLISPPVPVFAAPSPPAPDSPMAGNGQRPSEAPAPVGAAPPQDRPPATPTATSRLPVIEAGTFRVQEGFPSAEELLRDVDAINDPSAEQRGQGARQQTVNDFLRSLRTPAAPVPSPANANRAAEESAPTGELTADPLDVIADTEELTRGAPPSALRPATDSWLAPAQARPSGLGTPSRPAPSPSPQTRRPWSDFFHFPAGTKFEVDGPLGYNGNGKVLELTADVLKFELHLPEYEIAGYQIPKADIVITLTYVQEGAGNSATIDANGQSVQDSNVSIRTGNNRRHIVPSVSIPGLNLGGMSLAQDGKDEIDLKLTIDGTERDFDLER